MTNVFLSCEQEVLDFAKDWSENPRYTNISQISELDPSKVDDALSMLFDMSKEVEKLRKIAKLLETHEDMLSDLRQNIDSITHMNTSADPKKLRLLLELTDVIEGKDLEAGK